MRAPLARVVRRLSMRARQRRAATFRSYFDLTAESRILDLGSENGAHVHAVLEGTPVDPANVYLADIDAAKLADGARRFGFNTVTIDESGALPFTDAYFDVVFCSSVIEHVTVSKQAIWDIASDAEFTRLAFGRQRAFADEVRRVGRQYFVQTPYRWFPLESHTWLPFVGWLPRRLVMRVIRISNVVWIKTTTPDFNLLDMRNMRRLFPDALIVRESWLGLTKSMMAVKSGKARPAPV